MKGIEISKSYYFRYGKPALEKDFSFLLDRIAIGLVGEGSECFGFDDDISIDHDFEPGFCIFMMAQDYEKYGFQLQRMYAKLPKEFKGFKRQLISPVGGNRHGVMTIEDFYTKFLGTSTAPQDIEQWFFIPSSSLAAATNGEIFFDGPGLFSETREKLLKGYPLNVKLKKISAHLIMMQQAGLYNYERCIKRNENGAAQLCIFEFVKHTISVIYLLNNRYEPFYKWVYRGMRDFEILGELESSLVGLTELGNSETEFEAKKQSIEEICKLVINELKKQGITTENGYDLERNAIAIQNKITDPTVRNMHIMDGI